MTTGRLPGRPGEAVAGRQAAGTLGLVDGAGPVTTAGRHAGVVGVVDLTGVLTRFNDTVLVTAAPDNAGPLRYIYLVADNATDVPAIADLVAAAVWVDQPSQMTVETSEAILALQRVISGQLGASSRQLMAAVMGVGVAVVAATMFAIVGSKRRDFGRRRALGASRSAIVTLVLIQAGLTAVAGTIVGSGLGLLAVRLTSGILPTLQFTAGFVILAILAATAGAVPPAIVASRRDPVRELRVP
jgi:putative ABC transport system permease protein